MPSIYRTSFCKNHLIAAVAIAKQVQQLEKQPADEKLEWRDRSHLGLVAACIITTAAFLESLVNELCANTGAMSAQESLEEADKRKLAKLWEQGVPRRAGYSILQKYQIVLSVLDKETFVEAEGAYKNVELLVALRNSLIHFESSGIELEYTEESAQLRHEKIEQRLLRQLNALHYAPNPLFSSNAPFFPFRAMSFGLCQWSIESAITFADDFYLRLGTEPSYSSIRRMVTTSE